MKRKHPAGRSGCERPARDLLDRLRHHVNRVVLAEHHAAERFLERAQPLLVGGGRLLVGDARHAAHHPLDLRRRHGRTRRGRLRRHAHRHGRRVRRRARLQAQHCPRLVEDVDGAVWQAVVAQEALGQLRRHLDGGVGVLHLVVLLVARPETLEDPDRLLDRRLFDHHLLKPARERTVLLDLLELLEGGRADHPELTRGEHRLDQRREVHGAARRGASADGRVDLVDEQDRQPAALEGGEHRLEALLEIAAEARAGEQRGRVEAEDLRPGEDRGHVRLQEPHGEALGERSLADARVPDEHRVVLAPPAQDLHRPLQLDGAADERIQDARSGAVGEVDGVGTQRVAPGLLAVGGLGRRPPPAFFGRLGRNRYLRDAVGDVVEHVQPRDGLGLEQLGGVRVGLLQHRGNEVAGVHLRLARALHVEHRRLQHAPEGARLLRLLLHPARELLDRALEEGVQLPAEPRQIRAAGGEDPLTLQIVRQHVEQVLQGQRGVPAGDRLPVSDVQQHLDGRTEHLWLQRFTPARCSPSVGTHARARGRPPGRLSSRQSRRGKHRTRRGPADAPAS